MSNVLVCVKTKTCGGVVTNFIRWIHKTYNFYGFFFQLLWRWYGCRHRDDNSDDLVSDRAASSPHRAHTTGLHRQPHAQTAPLQVRLDDTFYCGQSPHCTGKTGQMVQKDPCQGKQRILKLCKKISKRIR